MEMSCDARDTATPAIFVPRDTSGRAPVERRGKLPLRSVNHVSFVVASLSSSLSFYRDVLGFQEIKRPDCFDFDGAWLFNFGIGIHLLKVPEASVGLVKGASKPINPKASHLSFQADNLADVESVLRDDQIPFVRQSVIESGVVIEQLFFHDPDGYMIEICNCECLPICPITAGGRSRVRRSPSLTDVQDLPMDLVVRALQGAAGNAPVTPESIAQGLAAAVAECGVPQSSASDVSCSTSEGSHGSPCRMSEDTTDSQ